VSHSVASRSTVVACGVWGAGSTPGSAAHRSAQHADRAGVDPEAFPDLGECRRELVRTAARNVLVHLENRVLEHPPAQLRPPAFGQSGAGQGQPEVHPPGIQAVQRYGGGERALGARRVHEVPRDDQRGVGTRATARRRRHERHAAGGTADH
jgi:hypothetical protein